MSECEEEDDFFKDLRRVGSSFMHWVAERCFGGDLSYEESAGSICDGVNCVIEQEPLRALEITE
ncbi:hypothetical protein A2U01_0111455, partial [Trifolium medium]|nr:hypothetical protein [Trifolium medium]